MPDSERTSSASIKTSALSPDSEISTLSPDIDDDDTSTVFMPTPPPRKRPLIYRTLSPLPILNRESNAPETPTVVSKSPMADDLPEDFAPFGTPDTDEREHEYTPTKAKRPKPAGGKVTRKRRRRRRKYKRSRKTV